MTQAFSTPSFCLRACVEFNMNTVNYAHIYMQARVYIYAYTGVYMCIHT